VRNWHLCSGVLHDKLADAQAKVQYMSSPRLLKYQILISVDLRVLLLMGEILLRVLRLLLVQIV
jgi:hypothetical protein